VVRGVLQNLQEVTRASKQASETSARGSAQARTELGRYTKATDEAAKATDKLKDKVAQISTVAGRINANPFFASISSRAKAANKEVDQLKENLGHIGRASGLSGIGGAIGGIFEGAKNIAGTVLGGILGTVRTITGAVMDLAGRIVGTLVDAFRTAAGVAGQLGAVGGAALAGISGWFAALGFKSNTFKEGQLAALEAMTKSKEAARDLYNFFSHFADVTPFDDQEVIEAGKALETFGLNARKNLQIVGDTAFAMKRPLEQVVGVLARMKAGSFDMVEAGAIGITREDLGKQGVKFSKAGEATNPEQLLPGALAVLQGRFGGAMNNGAQGMDAQSSTALSNIRRFAERATQGLFQSIERGLGKFNDIFSKLLESDAGQRLVKAIGVPFDLIGKLIENAVDHLPAFVDWLEKIVTKENVVNLLSQIAGWITALKDRVMGFLGLATGGQGLGGFWTAFKDGAHTALDFVVKGWNYFSGLIEYFVAHKDEVGDVFKDIGAVAVASIDVIIGAVKALIEEIAKIKFNPLGFAGDLYNQITGAGGGHTVQNGVFVDIGRKLTGGGQPGVPEPPKDGGTYIWDGRQWKQMAPGRASVGGALGAGANAVAPYQRQPGDPVQFGGKLGEWQRAGKEFREGVTKGAGDFFNGAIQRIPNKIGGLLGGADAYARGKAQQGIDGLIGGFNNDASRYAGQYRGAINRALAGPKRSDIPPSEIIGNNRPAAAAAAPVGLTDEQFEKQIDAQKEAVAALKERAEYLVSLAKDDQKPLAEANEMVKVLDQEMKSVILPQLQRYKAGSKEYGEASKAYWKNQAEVQKLLGASDKQVLENAKKAAGEVRSVAEAKIGLLEARLKNDPTLSDKQRNQRLLPALVEQFQRLQRGTPGESELEGIQRQTTGEGIKSRIMEMLGVGGKGLRLLGGNIQGYSKDAFRQLNDLVGPSQGALAPAGAGSST
jgi:hypothetical protein